VSACEVHRRGSTRAEIRSRGRSPVSRLRPDGVTWHGNYFRYLETARSALLDNIGYNYRQMVDSGYLWPVVDARIKYVCDPRLSGNTSA